MAVNQFSLKRMLAGVAVAGVVCLILAYAVRGNTWAVAVIAALVGLVLAIAVQGVLFALAWCLARLLAKLKGSPKASLVRRPLFGTAAAQANGDEAS